MAGLNPFSNSSAVEELRKGFSRAMSAAQSQLNSEGPITFRFAVDPVPTRDSGTSTSRTGTGGRNTALQENTELARQMGSQAESSRETADNIREQAEQARRATQELIRQNEQSNEMRRLNIELIGQESDRASLIRSNAEAQTDAANDIIKLEQQINDELAKGAQANRLVVDELRKQVDEKRTQLDITLQLNQAEYDRRLEIERQNNQLENMAATLGDIGEVFKDMQDDQLRAQLLAGRLSQEEYDVRKRIVDLTSDYMTKQRQDQLKLDQLRERGDIAGAERLQNQMASDTARHNVRMQQLEREYEFQKRLRNSAAAGARAAFEQAKRVTEPFYMAEQAVTSLFSNMNSAIDNFVDTGKFKFGDFARSIIADIIKIQLKAAATNIIGGIFGSIFPSIFGRAAGGPVQKNTPYLVGENGPELFIPGSMGSVLNNASLNKPADTVSGQPTKIINNYITNNISAIDSKSVAQMFIENRKSLLGAATVAQKEMPYGI
jgi:lambda family phage tail tape measure protein